MHRLTVIRAGGVLGIALLVMGVPGTRALAGPTDMDRAVDALIQVLGHPNANDGDKLPETNRAIRALVAIGRPAVPKLIDAVLGTNTNAALYAGHTLKEMTQSEVREPVRERWDRLGDAERWRLVPYVADAHFDAVVQFALASLEHKDPAIRRQAWGFVIQRRQARAVTPAKKRFLKALAGDEMPAVRWALLTDTPVFDAEKEADILIGLLRTESWAAKGEGRILPPGGTPPWWPDGRELVIPILAQRKVKRSAPALVNVLAEKGPGRAYLGHLIIPVLGEFGNKEAVPELKRILDTPWEKHERTLWGHDYIHALAASALLQLGDPAGRARSLELLKSKESLANGIAALAFAKFGTKDDLDVLGKLLDHESWQVRRDVCRGLERITGVVKRPTGWTTTTEEAAPLWKEWLRKNRKD